MEGGVKNDSKCLWSSLLKETSEKCTLKLSQRKGIVVLGDCESGKSTILARVEGTEEFLKSYGIEYRTVEVKDEDTDEEALLNCYVVDGGDTVFMRMLEPFIQPTDIEDYMAVVVVSMAEPWAMMRQLEHWVAQLSHFLNSLQLPPETLDRMQQRCVANFRGYVEEDDAVQTMQPVCAKASPLPPRQHNFHPASAAIFKAGDIGKIDTATERLKETSDVVPPLPEGALVNNLGIPLVVVVTKTDAMEKLEKDHNMNDEHFDFIQMHVRRFCLSYGAALIYTSVLADKNCAILKRYLLHRIYGFPYTQSAYVVEKECIFIPAGWDTQKKIAILEQNLTTGIRPGDAFHDVIPPPKPRKAPHREAEVVPEDEQTFLAQLQSSMQKDEAQMRSQMNSQMGDAMLDPYGGSRMSSNSPRTGNLRKPSTGGGPGGTMMSGGVGSGAVGVGGTGSNSSEGVLANFFNSLLSKRNPGAPGAPPPGTTPSNGPPADMSPKEMHSKLEKMTSQSLGGGENTASSLDEEPTPSTDAKASED